MVKSNENEISKLEHDDNFHVKKTSPFASDAQGNLVRQQTIGHPKAIKIDEVDSTTTYIGLANIGTLTSAASWQIRKIGVSGTVTTFTWADGDENYDNVWNDRVSLSYS